MLRVMLIFTLDELLNLLKQQITQFFTLFLIQSFFYLC